MPAEFVMAVSHAVQILQWQENLVSDDMPPEWMWPFDDALEAWFEEIRLRREDGTSPSDPPLVQNELSAKRR